MSCSRFSSQGHAPALILFGNPHKSGFDCITFSLVPTYNSHQKTLGFPRGLLLSRHPDWIGRLIEIYISHYILDFLFLISQYMGDSQCKTGQTT